MTPRRRRGIQSCVLCCARETVSIVAEPITRVPSYSTTA